MRIGYWVSEKKGKKLNFTEFRQLCRKAGYQLMKIDLDRSLEDQGPFDIIIHKITDVLAKVTDGCQKSKQRIKHFQDFTTNHPECIIVDPLESIHNLLDRHEQYKVIQKCPFRGDHVYTPSFVELSCKDVETNRRKLREANVQYPIVCKPTVAHGSQFSHHMLLVFNDDGLGDIQPPCVAQTFVNHGALLYKLFVVGDTMHLVERPSLRNFTAGDRETIFFDAHKVSKPDSCHDLNVLDDKNDQGPVQPDLTKMKALTDSLRGYMGMNLFGVDVIIDCRTKKYGIIDINFFPGYEGVPEFFKVLLKLVTRLVKERDAQNIALGCNNNEEKTSSLAEETLSLKKTKSITRHVKNVLSENGYKRLKLDQKENGVQSEKSEKLSPLLPNGSTPAVVANGNGIVLSCKASNGELNGRELKTTEMGNGIS